MMPRIVLLALLSCFPETTIADNLIQDETTTNSTSLAEALITNRADLIFQLLNSGVPVEIETPGCLNATHLAVITQDPFILRMILEAGADIDARDENGETPLMKTTSLELMRILIEFGADVNAEDSSGHIFFDNKVAMDEQMINALIDKTFSFGKFKSEAERIRGILAVDNHEVNELMRATRADVSGWFEWAQLLKACIVGDLQTISNWKAGRFNLNSQDARGKSGLIMAIENKQHEAVKLLVELGADVNNGGSFYDVPLLRAVENRMFDTVRFLLENGVDKNRNDALVIAIVNKDAKMAMLLIHGGIAIGPNEERGETPLVHAIGQRMLPVVKALVLAGADVNYIGPYETTPLMEAAYQGDIEITRFLIRSGADITIQNSDGDTAFTIAQKQKHDELFELLKQQH